MKQRGKGTKQSERGAKAQRHKVREGQRHKGTKEQRVKGDAGPRRRGETAQARPVAPSLRRSIAPSPRRSIAPSPRRRVVFPLCRCAFVASLPFFLFPFSFCLAASDPLEDTIGQMRTVQKRIETGDTGPQTRRLQQQIVENLERLIERAKQQLSQPNRPPQPPQPNQEPTNSGERKKPEKPNNTQPSASGDQKKQDDNAKDSTDRLDKGLNHKAKLTHRRETAKAVWGHLPPALRKELLNVFSEKYLPQYEDLIRSYYEALAEQAQKQPGR